MSQRLKSVERDELAAGLKESYFDKDRRSMQI